MAWFPCDVHGGPYRGKASNFYFGQLRGDDGERFALRCCPTDSRALSEKLDSQFARVDVDDTGDQLSFVCWTCGQPPSDVGSTAIFVTGYLGGRDRIDWYAQYCDPCGIPPWVPRTGRTPRQTRAEAA